MADIDIRRVEVSHDGAGRLRLTVTFAERNGAPQQVCVMI